MAIDFSFLDGVAPQQQQQAAPQDDVANVTLRVDADAMLLCDGEYMDIHLKGGVITKVQLPVGQHLLEFLSEENPEADVDAILQEVPRIVTYLRGFSPIWQDLESGRRAHML